MHCLCNEKEALKVKGTKKCGRQTHTHTTEIKRNVTEKGAVERKIEGR